MTQSLAEGSGPVLRDVVMHLATPAAPAQGVVVSNERCTASRKSAGFVRHVAVDISSTPLAGRFIAGQSFGVIPPGLDPSGKPHKLRLYSIASPSAGEDGQGRVLATTVKRVIDENWDTGKLFLGICSNYLCDLRVGDPVTVTGPSGKRFVLPQRAHEHDYLFFATGTGVAPFRGMVRDLLASASESRITLVLGSPYASDLIYHDEFRSLAASNPRFTYLPTLSRERQADGSPGCYVHDRLTTHREHLEPTLRSGRALIYVCGIAGMELGVVQQLTRLLPGTFLEQFVQADAATLEGVSGWTRAMLNKQVKLTRRLFLEVY